MHDTGWPWGIISEGEYMVIHDYVLFTFVCFSISIIKVFKILCNFCMSVCILYVNVFCMNILPQSHLPETFPR